MYKTTTANDFDAIRLKLASPTVIRAWSHGEVTRPETINYRTQKPERDGLFCERIFGPSKDWECFCGKYKKIRYKGIVCDKCGVEVTRALVRRERMGHIELAVPVSHIWFLRGVPSKIGLALNLSPQTMEKVVYFANFIITRVDEGIKEQLAEQLRQEFKNSKKDLENRFNQEVEKVKQALGPNPSESKLDEAMRKANVELDKNMLELQQEMEDTEKELREIKKYKLISEHEYQEMSMKYGPLFDADIGAEALYSLLSEIDLDKEIKTLEAEKDDSQGAKRDKLVKRLKLLRSLSKNELRPEWMVLTILPIIPPDLRPMVALDGGRFATSDLNDLYRRIINRNNRLKRLKELTAPEVIVRNEKRMLQEAVDALIDNSARHSKTVVASTGQKRQLKSLADILKGKQGRFRQNLLGKRVDYSGRSVIVVGPELKIYQCGLPKKMALELFKPFIISRLIKDGFVHNIRSANRFIESSHTEVWDILEEVTKHAHVFLNRAPTLHRLGIQAFQPILIEGKAIQLHPLVCPAFNADFDGDQMAVHVPLTEEAKQEAAHIMLSANNLLKPATGKPVVSPNKDIILGIYYLTADEPEQPAEEKIKRFSCVKEARTAYQLRLIGLRETIKVKDKFKSKKEEVLTTTFGRITFNSIVPEKLPYYNQTIDGKTISKIVSLTLESHLPEDTIEFLDKVKRLGFKYLTKSGYSWGMNDLPTLKEKDALITEGDKIVDEIEDHYQQGLLTQKERHSKIIETWTEIKDKIVELSTQKLDRRGSVFAMINSGARGSWGQLTQMVGLKGLVANPAGDIIELPVKGSFKQGFDVLEYFISTHGSRKGLSDTALRTANAGYLTRRLVDVAQDVVIREKDCGDRTGVVVTKEESEAMGETLAERVRGRYSLEEITGPRGKIIVKKNEVIDDAASREIEKLDLAELNVRSVFTCRLPKGLCQKCYGFDLGYNQLVNMGTAVGIVAAQSIGEPGTQLTMRTFHSGGVAGKDITQGLPRVEELFEARPPKHKAFVAEMDGIISIDETPRTITDPSGRVVLSGKFGQKIVKVNYQENEEDEYKFNKGAEVKVKDQESVAKGALLFTNPDDKKVFATREGIVRIDKNKVKIVADAAKATEYIIPREYSLVVKNGDLVAKGDRLTDGSLDTHQLYQHKGKVAVQKYMLKEIQHIYSSQGQKLNDKHVEIILKQLFSRVFIRDAGDTELLPGEIAENAETFAANEEAESHKKQPAIFDELFLGISKISLSTPSWLSAASFQETARVLINAATTGKIDKLEGLKENVIIGRRIPAGTGFVPKVVEKK
ncbi:MAG: DNA-directed RNA polymerase subunit beta' [Patescibacteria group bacterium]|jgi:DNA-directed RNA polymerase subunit beta'